MSGRFSLKSKSNSHEFHLLITFVPQKHKGFVWNPHICPTGCVLHTSRGAPGGNDVAMHPQPQVPRDRRQLPGGGTEQARDVRPGRVSLQPRQEAEESRSEEGGETQRQR